MTSTDTYWQVQHIWTASKRKPTNFYCSNKYFPLCYTTHLHKLFSIRHRFDKVKVYTISPLYLQKVLTSKQFKFCFTNTSTFKRVCRFQSISVAINLHTWGKRIKQSDMVISWKKPACYSKIMVLVFSCKGIEKLANYLVWVWICETLNIVAVMFAFCWMPVFLLFSRNQLRLAHMLVNIPGRINDLLLLMKNKSVMYVHWSTRLILSQTETV